MHVKSKALIIFGVTLLVLSIIVMVLSIYQKSLLDAFPEFIMVILAGIGSFAFSVGIFSRYDKIIVKVTALLLIALSISFIIEVLYLLYLI